LRFYVHFPGRSGIADKHTFNKFRKIDSDINSIDFSNDFCDIKKIIANTSFQGRIEIYYGVKNEFDRIAAERLSSFKQLQLFPIDTNSHNVAGHLKRQGILDDVLANIFD
jgi:hypothetical protein